jgi:hypothetical protein
MRTTPRLLFLTISLVALTLCTNFGTQAQQTSPDSLQNTVGAEPHYPDHASRADRGKPQEDGKASVEGRNHSRRSGKNHPGSGASPKASPQRVSKERHGSPSGKAIGHHQPGSDKRGDVAKSGLNHGTAGHSSQHVRRADVIRPTVPSLENQRHRGANPAIIGASAKPAGKNTGAISGTSVHRRP